MILILDFLARQLDCWIWIPNEKNGVWGAKKGYDLWLSNFVRNVNIR